jgi:hypothetical protein
MVPVSIETSGRSILYIIVSRRFANFWKGCTVARKMFNPGKIGQRDEVSEYFSEEEDWLHQSQVTASGI